jgi:hypothetical protein
MGLRRARWTRLKAALCVLVCHLFPSRQRVRSNTCVATAAVSAYRIVLSAMNDATQPAAAQGSLAKTPFAHLVLYLYQRRSSGTLIVTTESALQFETRVLFHRGRAVAAHLVQSASALDEGLLPLCGLSEGEFAFYESDLVGSGPAIVTGMFDPFAFVAESARRHARPDVVKEVVAKFAKTLVSLQPAMDVSRLSLTPVETAFTEPISRGPLTIESLCAQSELEPAAAQRLLYVLLITKIVGPYVPGSSESSVRVGVDASTQAPRSNNSSAAHAFPGPGPSSSVPAERSRSSGAAWRAIASRAAQMASNPPAAGPRTAAATPPPSAAAAPGSQPARRPPSRPLTPSPGFSQTPPRPQPAARPASRPLSRPLTPSPFGDVTPTPPRTTTPSSPISRVTPRPSPTPFEALDAPNKFKRVEQLCQRHAYEEALPLVRALVEEDRRSAKYLGMLSHVLLGRTSDGTIAKEIVETVNNALRLDPDEPHALYTKARCYKRMGKEREALHYFRRTIVVDPNHIEATREVRLLLLRMNEKKGKR